MRQVLFHIPLVGLPVYGYGMMLFLAFLVCTIVAGRRAEKEGIAKEHLIDVAMWLFVFGIIGARLTYMIQYRRQFTSPLQFFQIWDGGLVFYGSALGGVVGYAVAYYFVLRKHQLSTWKMADLIAPCVALGLCLGRMGCFLNGCCFGNVACADCPAVHFPLSSPARYALVHRGLQTPAGFALVDDDKVARVARVDPHSPAARADLRAGDEIIKVNDQKIDRFYDSEDEFSADTLWGYFSAHWPRGETDLTLTVRRQASSPSSKPEEITLETFEPFTVGLHPTQLYESISMILLFLLLSAFYPLRRHPGQVMVLFMLCYAVHRFLNEMIRKDTSPVAFGLTLSQNGSVILFLAGLALGGWLWWKAARHPSAGAAAA